MIVKHIRDTVLRTAEDKSHDAEEDRGVLCNFVLVIFKSVDSNKYEDVTQDAEQEQAQQAVICLYLAFTSQIDAAFSARPFARDSLTIAATPPVPIRFPIQMTGSVTA